MIRIACPNPDCRRVLNAPDELAGQLQPCPACGRAVHVVAAAPAPPAPTPAAFAPPAAPSPSAPAAPPSPTAATATAAAFIKLVCPQCHKHLRVPAEFAGQAKPCPACHASIQIQADDPERCALANSRPPEAGARPALQPILASPIPYATPPSAPFDQYSGTHSHSQDARPSAVYGERVDRGTCVRRMLRGPGKRWVVTVA